MEVVLGLGVGFSFRSIFRTRFSIRFIFMFCLGLFIYFF